MLSSWSISSVSERDGLPGSMPAQYALGVMTVGTLAYRACRLLDWSHAYTTPGRS
jgi:hypothetical protein